MQKLSRLSLALLLLIASTTFAPTAKAAPCQDIFTTYYDCTVTEVGWKWQGCGGGFSSSGQLSGAFKEIETEPCSCGDFSDTWYQWNGSSWVQISGPPSPTC